MKDYPYEVKLHVIAGTANKSTLAYLYKSDRRTIQTWLDKLKMSNPESGNTFNPKEVKRMFDAWGEPDILAEIKASLKQAA